MSGINEYTRFKSIFQIFIVLQAILILTSDAEYIPPGPLYPCPIKPSQIKSIYPCVCEKGSDVGLYVSCENTGLATLSIGLSNVANINYPVEQLTLKQCNIGRLFGPILHRLRVRILRIEDTPIMKIDEDFMYGVNLTLQEFYLVNSSLNVFPKEALKMMSNLTILHIDKHQMKTLDKDIFAGSLALGKLERLHIINGELTELQVESFQSLRKLKTLDLHGNQLTTLKRGQFKGLRNAEVLDISYNNINKLDSSHIADLTKLSWCNVSHNQLTEMSRGMFARAVLKVLHMDHNKLKRLDTNSFRGMRFLRRLYLSDNEIAEVGRGTFSSITRIGTIDLARNKIKKIDYQMFYQLNYIEIIDVSDNQLTEIQKLSFKDLYLTKINMSYNSISKIEAGAFENCANMTILNLSYNNLTEINPKAFDSTTYANELQLSYNQFTILNQIPLHNMSGLKILNVSYNMISSIPKNTFPKLYELHTVDVSHNQLKEIASAVFQSLFSLRYLNLSHNVMEQIKPPTFGTLPTVLELNLSNNLLTDVSRGALAKLASCRRLDISHNFLQKIFQMPISLGDFDLSYNNISSLPENVWPSMNALLKLDLSFNPVGLGLYSESFNGLLTLQTLVLTGTSILRPPWEALSKLSSLQYLKLNQNNITALNKGAFGRLPIVFDLDLSDNQIKNVSQRAFDGLLQLLALSLRNNNITHIPNGAFHGLVSLRSLDLSQNFLEKIDNKTNGLLDDCLSIERVNLSYNKISFVTRKTFPSDSYIPYKLKEIDLSYNAMPVITGDLAFGTKKLEVLNISNNILNDMRKGVIGNLTSLKVLDLSNNDLHDLTSDKDLFRLPPNIRIINLSNNRLLKLPVEHITNAANLTVLNVRNNSLEFFDKNLVPKIKEKKLQVYFGGNPLKCDCFTRPLKHYLDHLPRYILSADNIYSDIICAEPVIHKDVPFISTEDSMLNCIENVAIRKKLDDKENGNFSSSVYEKESDLVFRDVQFAQTAVAAQWFVQSTKDIANFRIIIRNPNNDIFYSNIIPYNKRRLLIDIEEDVKLKQAVFGNSRLELCILAGNSAMPTYNWFQSQCVTFPEDMKLINKDLPARDAFRYSNLLPRKKMTSSAIRHNDPNVYFVIPFYGCVYFIISKFFFNCACKYSIN